MQYAIVKYLINSSLCHFRETVASEVKGQALSQTQNTRKLYGQVFPGVRNGKVMDCHATARDSIPGGNGVKLELHVLRKGQ